MKKLIEDFLLGVLAGAVIAIGGILNVIAKTYVPGEGGKVLGAFLFPIGLTLVCFLGFNLYTGKIAYVIDKKSYNAQFLATIYVGNFVGAFLVGCLMYIFFHGDTEIFKTVKTIANAKADSVSDVGGVFKVLGFSCLCGMLVYMAVSFYKSFKNNVLKVVGIFIPIALFVYLGFDHCIANMYYFGHGFLFLGFISGSTYLNIAIATIGNTIGAILLHSLVKVIAKKQAD